MGKAFLMIVSGLFAAMVLLAGGCMTFFTWWGLLVAGCGVFLQLVVIFATSYMSYLGGLGHIVAVGQSALMPQCRYVLLLHEQIGSLQIAVAISEEEEQDDKMIAVIVKERPPAVFQILNGQPAPLN